MRAAEPIHVTRGTLTLAAVGFVVWAIGYLLIWASPTGTRLEWILCAAGPILLAVAILNHLDHHRRRFGILALILLNVAVVLQAVVFVPYAVNPALRGTPGWGQFAYVAWGASWIIAALGVFVVLARKEARIEHGDKTAETEIHATFFQLATLAVGMLIYGLSFIGLSTDRNSQFLGWLTVIGPALIAVSIIAHVEHLSLRIGRPAVILAIIGVSVWAAKNLVRATTTLMSDPGVSTLVVYGIQGIILMLGAIACVLVLLHKRAWQPV